MQNQSTPDPNRATPSSPLISSDRVQGTEVFDTRGTHIGSIDSLVIDKVSGQVVYAMMSFGGFLGLGESYYPIPWGKLRYDVTEGGYRTDLTEEMVKNAPAYSAEGYLDDTVNTGLFDYYSRHGMWDGESLPPTRRR